MTVIRGIELRVDTGRQRLDLLGYGVDPTSGELSRYAANGVREPLAFAVDALTLRYLYVAPDGDVETRDAPYENAEGAPLRTVRVGGEERYLDAVRVTLVGRAEGPFGTMERTLTTLAPLPDPGPQTAEVVVPCA